MTNAERLALARNKLARLETARRLAWDAGNEDEVRAVDADIAATNARIVEFEAGQ
jgi:hypothetical protein